MAQNGGILDPYSQEALQTKQNQQLLGLPSRIADAFNRAAQQAGLIAKGGYPPLDTWDGPGSSRISPYDLITFNGVAMPLVKLRSGTALDIDKQKGRSHNWHTLVSKGYRAEETHMTLALYLDTLTGMNWLERWEAQVRDMLMPKAINLLNAVKVYHPFLSGDGISQILMEKRGIPEHVGKQIFHVDVVGWDLRFAGEGQGNVTKKAKPSPGMRAQPNALRDAVEAGNAQASPALGLSGGEPTGPNQNFTPGAGQSLQSVDPNSQATVSPAMTLAGAA